MANSMRCLSSKTSCPKSSSHRRAVAARGMAPFTAATQTRQASLVAPAQQHQSRRQQTDSHIVCVAAQEAAPSTAGAQKTWYALVANAEFFCNDVQNEALAEQLREKTRYYKEQNNDMDFFLIPNPTWLDAKFPEQGKLVKRPCMALVTPDKMWADFMKVRLDRVLRIELKGLSDAEVLAMGEALPEFKKPAVWTAPYSPYAAKWWEVFYPSQK